MSSDDTQERVQDGIFNARWLSPAEIAQSFVPPPYFERLAAASHTLLVGPRGCGKTTLLKMLQPAALNAWGAPAAERIKEIVTYSGVFIPADISWKEQVDSLTNSLAPEIRKFFSQAAFTTSLLHSLVDTALWRIARSTSQTRSFRSVTLDRDVEAGIAEQISREWQLGIGVPSLLGIKHKLRARLLGLPMWAAELAESGTVSLSGRDDLRFLRLPPLQSASFFVELFDDAIGESSARWALMFDEMEIAPDWVQQSIFSSTRSTNPKLLLKIALSPFNPSLQISEDGSSPNSLNDFEQTQLWFAHRDADTQRGRPRAFCESLWKNTAHAYGLLSDNPYKVLGDSFALPDSDGTAEEGLNASRRAIPPYSARGKWGLRFRSLARKDASFKRYLDELRLNPDELDHERYSEVDRARMIRKVTTLVALRDFYRKSDDEEGGALIRSRKGADLYTGAETYFLLSEGHPRWLKVTLGRMLDGLEPGASSVSRSKQGSQITAFAHRFAALLKTFPSSIPVAGGPSSVWDLVRSIGDYFHHVVVEAPFDAEPPLSFTVDSNTQESIIGLLQIAVNLGAVVYVPDDDGEVLLRSLRGKRFRLSYWLAPIFKLPPTLGRSVSLSTVLGIKPVKRAHKNYDLPLGLE